MGKSDPAMEALARGYWDGIHRMGLSGQYLTFRNHMYFLKDNYPCDRCRPHIADYLRTHPIPDRSGGDTMYLFKWSVDFHNAVNKRLGKRELSLSEAFAIYQKDCPTCSLQQPPPSLPPPQQQWTLQQQRRPMLPNRGLPINMRPYPTHPRR